jgi:prepilin-type N-terminal cleavage/methylation domain-containing protein
VCAHSRRMRPAFTLVELLVVMALILVLAALAVAFYPDISTSERASRGAGNVQSWLLIAKQRAKRDRLPTGIRFLPYTAPGTSLIFCNQMQYIQQPPDYAVGRCTAVGTDPFTAAMTATINTNIQSSQYAQADEAEFDVQNGDYFELYGGGFIRQIFSVSPSSSTTTLTMLTSSAAYPGSSTSPTITTTSATNPGPNYRIVRQPRELPGEPILTLPYNIAIDLNTAGGVTLSNPPQRTSLNPTTSYFYYEIVFSPSGAVIGSGNQNPYDGQIYLWVRDVTVPDVSADLLQGLPTIVSVQTRSGLIGAYPVAPITSTYNSDPFYFTKQARSSGL